MTPGLQVSGPNAGLVASIPAAAIGVRMHKGQKLDKLVLGRRQQALVARTKRILGLAQIRHDEATALIVPSGIEA